MFGRCRVTWTRTLACMHLKLERLFRFLLSFLHSLLSSFSLFLTFFLFYCLPDFRCHCHSFFLFPPPPPQCNSECIIPSIPIFLASATIILLAINIPHLFSLFPPFFLLFQHYKSFPHTSTLNTTSTFSLRTHDHTQYHFTEQQRPQQQTASSFLTNQHPYPLPTQWLVRQPSYQMLYRLNDHVRSPAPSSPVHPSSLRRPRTSPLKTLTCSPTATAPS